MFLPFRNFTQFVILDHLCPHVDRNLLLKVPDYVLCHVGILFLIKYIFQYELDLESSVVALRANESSNFVVHLLFAADLVAVFGLDIAYIRVGHEGLEDGVNRNLQGFAVLCDYGTPDRVLKVFGPLHELAAVVVEHFL